MLTVSVGGVGGRRAGALKNRFSKDDIIIFGLISSKDLSDSTAPKKQQIRNWELRIPFFDVSHSKRTIFCSANELTVRYSWVFRASDKSQSCNSPEFNPRATSDTVEPEGRQMKQC